MRFNVSQLLQEPVGALREHDLRGMLGEVDEHNMDPVPVTGHVTLIRTPKGILAKGRATCQLVEPCRRCLEPALLVAEIEIEDEFIPSIDIVTGASLPITDEDEEELLIDEHHILDLTEVVRQYALVEVTVGALCQADCKGLCPVCGANRNQTTCDCDTKTLDPRLAVLAQMLNDQKRKDDAERNINS